MHSEADIELYHLLFKRSCFSFVQVFQPQTLRQHALAFVTALQYRLIKRKKRRWNSEESTTS